MTSVIAETHLSNTDFTELVRARRTERAFLPDPLDDAELQGILLDAQQSPSNCNSQPWTVHVVSGRARDALSEALVSAFSQGQFTPDFSFSTDDYAGRLAERVSQQGAAYYDFLGIDRADQDERAAAAARNLSFFGAPHVALLFTPVVGDTVRAAADVGMYAQTFLLSLAARGLGGAPQTMVGFFAKTIREVLGIPDEFKMLFAISFGHPDKQAPSYGMRMVRDPIEANVIMHA